MKNNPHAADDDASRGFTRRAVFQSGAALATANLATLAVAQQSAPMATAAAANDAPAAAVPEMAPQRMPLSLEINGEKHQFDVDMRTTLLDALRENLKLTGSKKGCDHGQCGACTVLIDGRRTNACLTLAVMHDGQAITTIEGLAKGDALHPVQEAFLKHDGFQCGYCTPGQICSTVGMLAEVKMGMPSQKTLDLKTTAIALSDEEIRERMSGNLCRCSAYPNIVAAIKDVSGARS